MTQQEKQEFEYLTTMSAQGRLGVGQMKRFAELRAIEAEDKKLANTAQGRRYFRQLASRADFMLRDYSVHEDSGNYTIRGPSGEIAPVDGQDKLTLRGMISYLEMQVANGMTPKEAQDELETLAKRLFTKNRKVQASRAPRTINGASILSGTRNRPDNARLETGEDSGDEDNRYMVENDLRWDEDFDCVILGSQGPYLWLAFETDRTGDDKWLLSKTRRDFFQSEEAHSPDGWSDPTKSTDKGYFPTLKDADKAAGALHSSGVPELYGGHEAQMDYEESLPPPTEEQLEEYRLQDEESRRKNARGEYKSFFSKPVKATPRD